MENGFCNNIKPLISAYFDDELSSGENDLVRSHIDSCPECADELENIKNLSGIIKNSFKNTGYKLDIASVVISKLDGMHICNDVAEKLSPYIDRELDKKELSAISEHLLSCNHCRREYENLKEIQSAVKNYLENIDNHSSHKIAEGVINRIKKQERRLEYLKSTAALFIIALLSWFSINTISPFNAKINDKARLVSLDKSAYLRSEDFLFTKVYSSPPEGAISTIYEED